ELLRRHLPQGLPVQDIKIGIAPQGVVIQGVYPMFIKVAFETLWEPAIQQGKLLLKLSQFKAMGMGGNMFKGAILKQIADHVQGMPKSGASSSTSSSSSSVSPLARALSDAASNRCRASLGGSPRDRHSRSIIKSSGVW